MILDEMLEPELQPYCPQLARRWLPTASHVPSAPARTSCKICSAAALELTAQDPSRGTELSVQTPCLQVSPPVQTPTVHWFVLAAVRQPLSL